MGCPFLKEAQAGSCQAAPVRKMIPLAQAGRGGEICSSPGYEACAVYQAQAARHAPAGQCPHLRESLMQYCGAAPVTRLIPYSEPVLSRCGSDSFRYCELYLGMAHPEAAADEVDGIRMPGWLRYSANHMWLDVTGDGACHAGIDAFFSRALGKVERVAYVWTKGLRRPTAVLTAGGIDVEVVFPNEFLITGCNLYLRADASRISAEPYTGGWLFEGTPQPGTTRNLMEGAAARHWMEQEQRRMNEQLQQQVRVCGATAADGGLFAAGLPGQLGREPMLGVIHEFFSPFASGER